MVTIMITMVIIRILLHKGPTCALACPAALVWRNYFCQSGEGQLGGSEKQINTARDMATMLVPCDDSNNSNTDNNENDKRYGSSHSTNGVYWNVQNGYLLPTSQAAMVELNQRLRMEDGLKARLRDSLRVGVQVCRL